MAVGVVPVVLGHGAAVERPAPGPVEHPAALRSSDDVAGDPAGRHGGGRSAVAEDEDQEDAGLPVAEAEGALDGHVAVRRGAAAGQRCRRGVELTTGDPDRRADDGAAVAVDRSRQLDRGVSGRELVAVVGELLTTPRSPIDQLELVNRLAVKGERIAPQLQPVDLHRTIGAGAVAAGHVDLTAQRRSRRLSVDRELHVRAAGVDAAGVGRLGVLPAVERLCRRVEQRVGGRAHILAGDTHRRRAVVGADLGQAPAVDGTARDAQPAPQGQVGGRCVALEDRLRQPGIGGVVVAEVPGRDGFGAGHVAAAAGHLPGVGVDDLAAAGRRPDAATPCGCGEASDRSRGQSCVSNGRHRHSSFW